MNIIPVPFLLSPGPVSVQVGSRIRGWSHPVSSVFVFAQTRVLSALMNSTCWKLAFPGNHYNSVLKNA